VHTVITRGGVTKAADIKILATKKMKALGAMDPEARKQQII
jgi:hypothetical protein